MKVGIRSRILVAFPGHMAKMAGSGKGHAELTIWLWGLDQALAGRVCDRGGAGGETAAR